MKELFALMWGSKRDMVLVALVLGVLAVLFVPVPSPLLDFLLVINISLALLILLVTFLTESPLKFSTFPTILLLATLLRLSLNVSATRLILSGGEAGRVIAAIGQFVVRGNYVVGIVVFLILVVVQYVVVTSGAQRVAEVAARFTLDSMPGKQMSIDADMNMGLIDDKEARARRAQVEM
jgi:flagellar biosynthesis protein FlhA